MSIGVREYCLMLLNFVSVIKHENFSSVSNDIADGNVHAKPNK